MKIPTELIRQWSALRLGIQVRTNIGQIRLEQTIPGHLYQGPHQL